MSNAANDGGGRVWRGMPMNDRFWLKVAKGPGCWEWSGSIHRSGYGHLSIKRHGSMKAHRYSWELHNGPIPTGLVVCHRCDNRRCVRPDHLFLGTHADNVRDCIAKGRFSRGEKHAAIMRAVHAGRRGVAS